MAPARCGASSRAGSKTTFRSTCCVERSPAAIRCRSTSKARTVSNSRRSSTSTRSRRARERRARPSPPPSGGPVVPQPAFDAVRQPGGRRLALDQVIEAAQLGAALDQLLFGVARQNHDWNSLRFRVGTQGFQDIKTVKFRQTDVEKND